MKIVIGLVIILSGLLLCTSFANSHGEGKCEDGSPISHTMPDWWVSEANWYQDQKHRHWISRGDYVQTWNTDPLYPNTFDDCGPRPSTPTTTAPTTTAPTTTTPTTTTPTTTAPTTTTPTTTTPTTTTPTTVEITTPPETVEIPPEPDPEVVVYERWEYQFWRGWNFVSFPVLPEGVETLGDLWHRWTFMEAFNAWIFLFVDDQWLLYTGNPQDKAGAVQLQPNHALVIYLNSPSWLGVTGIPLVSKESVEIEPGVSGIGLTELPDRYSRPSDLLSNSIQAVLVEQKGRLYLIGRAGDPGDKPFRKGQAVFTLSKSNDILYLQSVPSAPSVQ